MLTLAHQSLTDTKKGPLKSDPLVIRMRLERMTVCLEGRCSIQLSYRTDLAWCKDTQFLNKPQFLNPVLKFHIKYHIARYDKANKTINIHANSRLPGYDRYAHTPESMTKAGKIFIRYLISSVLASDAPVKI